MKILSLLAISTLTASLASAATPAPAAQPTAPIEQKAGAPVVESQEAFPEEDGDFDDDTGVDNDADGN